MFWFVYVKTCICVFSHRIKLVFFKTTKKVRSPKDCGKLTIHGQCLLYESYIPANSDTPQNPILKYIWSYKEMYSLGVYLSKTLAKKYK